MTYRNICSHPGRRLKWEDNINGIKRYKALRKNVPDADLVSSSGDLNNEGLPTLTPYLLKVEKLHPAIIVCPGGSFQFLASSEGEPIAKWLNQIGINAFVLNYRVAPFTPFTSTKSFLLQLEILMRAEVFITHAGFNSVNEALYFGVPMLALPQVNDQHMVAKRLVSMQLGMMENIKELSPDILRSKAETLIMDKNIKEKCAHISREMRTFAQLEQTV